MFGTWIQTQLFFYLIERMWWFWKGTYGAFKILMVSFSNENPDFVDNSNSEHLMRVKNGITLLLNQVQCTKEQVSVLISLYRAKDRQRLKIVYNPGLALVGWSSTWRLLLPFTYNLFKWPWHPLRSLVELFLEISATLSFFFFHHFR